MSTKQSVGKYAVESRNAVMHQGAWDYSPWFFVGHWYNKQKAITYARRRCVESPESATEYRVVDADGEEVVE